MNNLFCIYLSDSSNLLTDTDGLLMAAYKWAREVQIRQKRS